MPFIYDVINTTPLVVFMRDNSLHLDWSTNGPLKHEPMPDFASYDVKRPKSFYSDSVISVFCYTSRFGLFYHVVTLFD